MLLGTEYTAEGSVRFTLDLQAAAVTVHFLRLNLTMSACYF